MIQLMCDLYHHENRILKDLPYKWMLKISSRCHTDDLVVQLDLQIKYSKS